MVDSTNLPNVDINAIATDLNNKADRDLTNSTAPYVVSRTANSLGGMTEIWSDGYCVQTGLFSLSVTTAQGKSFTVTLPQSYVNNNYYCNISTDVGWSDNVQGGIEDVETTYFSGFLWHTTHDTTIIVRWETKGYIR